MSNLSLRCNHALETFSLACRQAVEEKLDSYKDLPWKRGAYRDMYDCVMRNLHFVQKQHGTPGSGYSKKLLSLFQGDLDLLAAPFTRSLSGLIRDYNQYYQTGEVSDELVRLMYVAPSVHALDSAVGKRQRTGYGDDCGSSSPRIADGD